jgi:aspartyl-tRNA(Asn)/glutamyl-tRNA(Gln) amidotransferase subunit A
MCLAALGSQTVGSLTRPASFCGVCSLKPDIAAAGSDGVLPFAPTLDHVGVMARCVTDLAILAGVVLDDSAAAAPPLAALGGVFVDRAEPAMRAAMAEVSRIARPADRTLPALAADLPRHLRAILATEAAAYHGDRLRRHPDDYPPAIRGLVEEGLRVPTEDYRAALAHRDALRAELSESLFAGGVTVLTPATPGPAPDRSTTGDAVFNAPWSYTGYPTVSLPIGRTDDGLPLAAQLVGRTGEVPRLLGVAAGLERQLDVDIGLPSPET